MRTCRKILLSVISALCLTAITAVAAAQPGADRGPGYDPGLVMGPGNGLWPGMMGSPDGFGPMCGPGIAGFAEWRVDRLQSLLELTDTQKQAFDAYRVASRDAADAMRANCPADFPKTTRERMARMETRMKTMLIAIKTMRPALDAFYATLSDEQKAKLDSSRGYGRSWRWRENW